VLKRTLRDVDVQGKRALVRVDLNVPIDGDGHILDDTRIRAILPTIAYLRDQRAAVVLMSHLGRPKGGPDPSLSLREVAFQLTALLGVQVPLAPDCVGPEAERLAFSRRPGDVLLLENLRFHPEEEANDAAFSAALARLGDMFVNDAFGTAHRTHESTVGVTAYLPAVAGLLMEKELEELGRVLEAPGRPFAAIVGGAKISTKAGVLKQLLGRVDILVIGGAMANTFFKADGLAVGDSLVEDDSLDTARTVQREAEAHGVELILPEDVLVADSFSAQANTMHVAASAIPPGWRAMDVGPKTVERIQVALRKCRTILWNGPVGVFEFPAFGLSTIAVARAMAAVPEATTIIGGGETVAAVHEAGVADKMSHISTGGGATLEFLEGRTLPGVAALLDR
jgi:phosphoglycerate kinase